MKPRKSRRRRYLLILFALLVAVVVCTGLSTLVGPAGAPIGAVFGALLDGLRCVVTGQAAPADSLHTIVLSLRLPRAILACLVGACLALAGVVMQALFQNPMADPYLVGVSGGAGLGAVAAMMLGINVELAGFTAVPLLAFTGALGVTLLVYLLSQRGGKVQTATLLLTGIAVGSLVASITAFLMLSRDEHQAVVLSWMLGSLSGRTWLHVWAMVPQFVLGLGISLALARPLNVLLLGDEAATHVGLDVHRAKRWLLALSSLLAAAAVAVSGVIGFVGLVIPHICRLIVGPDHRILLPVSALAGALLLVLADIPARLLLSPGEIPIGIITSLLGCPFFLYLLHRHGARRL